MKKLLLSLFFLLPLSAMEMIDPSAVSSAQQLKLYANEKNLFVEDENAAYRVERHDMNPLLREVMHRQAMGKFIGDGYIRVNKFEDGKYELIAKVRGDGGFLLTGVIVYQSCRVIGYSGILLGGGSAIVAGYVAGGPVGAVTAASGVIAAAPQAAAAIESGSLAIGTAASWIPGLP